MHVMVETEKWAAVAHQVRLQVRYCTGSACQQALEQHLGQMWQAQLQQHQSIHRQVLPSRACARGAPLSKRMSSANTLTPSVQHASSSACWTSSSGLDSSACRSALARRQGGDASCATACRLPADTRPACAAAAAASCRTLLVD
eukprot:CAMPEP_0195605554 /NCGR_PEP_ID=MMETSP0815-20121206/7217_1 /TAXON_ID=97485 /ORGANISM="Prymnesium parvum, Strain Texoma1" /LENGTH=143 /DNA_ID=CAMNT_0040745243 /DNA_START=204 /DNA_END=636 /DNA_ORIENTATION=-